MTFSVGDLPRLASQVSCVLAVYRDGSNLVQALHQKSVGILRQFRGFIHLFTIEWSSFDLVLIPVMKKKTKFGNEGKEKGSALKNLLLNEYPVGSYKKWQTLNVHLTAKDNLAARPKLK